MYIHFFKRLFDLVIAMFSLLILLPVFIFMGILVRIKIGSLVLFRQFRIGLNGKTFKIFKFRTMIDIKDNKGNLLPDSERLTAFGKFLRSTSLDELPQLINIIKGDMSLVGPRPLLPEYVSLYNDFQRRRHEVKPGITGWAQINGRNAISWEQKFEFDVWYVDHISFKLDMKILFLTVLNVLKGSGINASNNLTMEKFKG